MKFCFLLLFLIPSNPFTGIAQEQKKYKHQVSVISENDSYAFRRIDRYYTSGFALRFTKVLKPETTKRKLLNAEIGQSIYTPYSIKKNYQLFLDRPFTGFLYAKGGLTYLYKNENVLSWNLLAGVIGPAAKGEEMQKIIHRILNFSEPMGWHTQLQSEFGVNIHGSYAQHLVNHQATRKRSFDAFAISKATAGTTFNRLSQSFLFRLGSIEPSNKSAWWDCNLKTDEATSSLKHELFFYFEPTVEYQFYNATIQGGVFAPPQPYEDAIQPVVYSHRFGGMYAKNRYSIQLGYTFTTKDARSMMKNSTYGTIALGFRF